MELFIIKYKNFRLSFNNKIYYKNKITDISFINISISILSLTIILKLLFKS